MAGPLPEKWYRVALRLALLVYAMSASLRLWHHLTRTALWIDEAGLAMNVTSRAFADMGSPFLYYQACGWGFLVVSKIAVSVLGDSEHVLRAIPLVCGLSLPLLLGLTAHRFISKTAGVIALLLSSVNPAFVYYSAEYKPYGVDAFVAALILWLALRAIERPKDKRRQIALAVFGTVAPLLSLPAIFVLGGVGGAFLLNDLLNRHPLKRFLFTGLMLATWVFAFGLQYIMFLAHSATAQSRHIKVTFDSGFAPFPPTSLADIRWYAGKYFYAFYEPGGFHPRYIGGLLFVLGLVFLFRKGLVRLAVFLGPFVLLIIASSLEKYPAVGRLLIFIVPLIVLIASAGLSMLIEQTTFVPKAVKAVSGVLLLIFVGTSSVRSLDSMKGAVHGEKDLRDAITYMFEHHQPGDRIFVEETFAWPYDYYVNRARFPHQAIISTQRDIEIPLTLGDHQHKQLIEFRVKMFGHKRVWVLLPRYEPKPGHTDADRFFTEYIDRHGKRLDSLQTKDAAVYLYDLTNAR